MMEKPISRKEHGFIDYSYIPITAFAPKLFGFEDDETAKMIAQIQSGSILLSTLFTRAEWGLFKIMPYKLHLILDTTVSLFSLSAPWVFGFSKNRKARNAFLMFGAFGIAASLLSKPEEMPNF